MVNKSLRMPKFDGTGKIDFGRWKTKMLAIAAIKGNFDTAYLQDLPTVVNATATATNPVVVTQVEAEENLKKRNLAMNYLIVYLEGQPLRVVTNTTSGNPYDAWNALVAKYEPATVEAYSQLLNKMEGCILEDPYKNP